MHGKSSAKPLPGSAYNTIRFRLRAGLPPATKSHKTKYMPQLKFLDLFCGCGGFSLGMEKAGLQCLAAIDHNPHAIKIFKHNFPQVPIIMQADLTSYDPQDLAETLTTPEVDLIIGGPPCQGFSIARRVGGSNSGKNLVPDARRQLYQEFLRFVSYFRPKVFVMENVLGIESAAGGEYYQRVLTEARDLGYHVVAYTENAADLGAPQRRRRKLFIGTKESLGIFSVKLNIPARLGKQTTLGEAIMDLPGQKGRTTYDLKRRAKFQSFYPDNFLTQIAEVSKAALLDSHDARKHNDRDLRDFKRLHEGENSKQATERGVQLEHPYDQSSFQDRFTRQSRSNVCSTIVAHLSQDGLMFIHPTQNRSLTPREAARIQTFPDWFQFPVATSHKFKAIGNAVPPLVAEALGHAITSFLNQPDQTKPA